MYVKNKNGLLDIWQDSEFNRKSAQYRGLEIYEGEVEVGFDGKTYIKNFAPAKPVASNLEIKALRAKEYIIAIDPITAEISRLKDEEATPENQLKINELMQLRKTKVEEIKTQYPYNL